MIHQEPVRPTDVRCTPTVTTTEPRMTPITLAERITLRNAFMEYAVEASDDLYHYSPDCPMVRDALVGRPMPHPVEDGVTVTVEDAYTSYLYYVDIQFTYTDPATGETRYGETNLVRDGETNA